MTDHPFAGATRDPIALLEQLIGQVGGLKSHMDDVKQELKQEIGELRQELKQEIGELRQELKQEIGELRQELKQEIGELRQELKQEIGGLRQELKQEISGLRQDMQALEVRQTKLEGSVREFHNESAAQLDRIEGIFSHVAKKWMEHDEAISRLKRRQV